MAALVGAAFGQTVTISQSFQSASPTGWNFSTPNSSYTPQSGALTDSSGTNWLELANNTGNEATAAYYTGNFNSTGASVYATFNYQMYGGSGGTTIGGDGITFFLYDASKSFSAGAYGGSMGYAQKTGINGLNGGYLGVGLDAYGNYSSATEGRVGGYNNTTGQVTESIAVRGPGQGTNGYAYLGGTSAHLGTGNTSNNIDSTTRPSTTNTVQILLSATNQLTVTLAQGGSTPQTVLQMDLSGYARPDLLSFGFTAGTGAATDYMLINNLTVTTVTASKWIGGTTNWGLNTNWNPSVVPTNGSDILFDNSYVSSAQTIDTGANRTIRSITFDAPFDYTVNNNTITIDNGGVSGFSGIQVTQTHGTGVDTINSNLALNNDIHVTNNASGTLNLNGAIANSGHAITFDGSGTGTNVAGVISGTGGITKNDAGTVTLSGANTFSGGTTLNAGTLNANSNTALGTGNVTMTGGTLGSTNNSTINNAITLSGNGTLSGLTNNGTLTQAGANRTLIMSSATQAGNVSLSDTTTAHTLTVEVDSGNSTISGAISNGAATSGNVTKTGAGTLTLGPSNSYTGTLTISNGTVQLGGTNSLAQSSAVGIDATGTLNLNGFSQKIGNLAALNGGATLDFGAGNTGNTFVFGSYTAPASGVLTVNNWTQGSNTLASTVSGQTVNSIYLSGYGIATESGTLSSTLYGNAYLLTAMTQTNVVWSGTSSSSWTTNSNWVGGSKPTSSQIAAFDSVGNARTAVTVGGNTTIAGIKFFDDSPNTAGSYSIGGTSTITLTGTLPYIQQQSVNSQAISAKLALAANSVIDITGAGNLTLSGVIAQSGTGSRTLTKTGTGGKLILSGANTFAGGLYVNDGVVQASGTNAVLGTGNATVSSGATLELSGGTNLSNALSIAGIGAASSAGALHSVAGANTLSGTITETAASTIAADSGTSLTLTNGVTGSNVDTTLSGAGNVTLGAITTGTGNVTVNSTGTVTLNGNANTNTGVTTVNSGTLVLAKAAGTTAVNGNLVINGGAVQLNASNEIANTSSATLTGSGILNLNGNSDTLNQITSSSTASKIQLGAGSLTINAINGQNSSYAGALTGTSASSFNVAGVSKVYLSGDGSLFSGAVNVTGGTLNASGSNTALGSGTVTVSSGANLQVQGGISLANALTLNGTGANSNGALENVANNNTLSGAVTVASASLIESDSGSNLTLSGATGLGANTLTFGGAGNTTVSGNIGGTGGIIKSDAGTVTLTGTNGYTGTTTISGGTLQIGNGGTTGTLGTGGAVTDNANLVFNRSDTALNVANAISGTGNITQAGPSTSAVTLSGSNGSFTGAINVNSGTLIAANSNALGSSAVLTTIASGAALGLSGNISTPAGSTTLSGTGVNNSGALFNQSGTNTYGGNLTLLDDTTIAATTGSLTLSGSINLGSGVSASKTLTFNTATGTTIIASGQITDSSSPGTLNLAFTGNGTLTLSNAGVDASGNPLATANGYNGDTTIGVAGGTTTGTLSIGAKEALPTVNPFSTIRIYSGTLALGAYNATAEGNITLGGGGAGSTANINTSAATLKLNHDLTFDSTNNANGAMISGNLALVSGSHNFIINDSTAAANDLTISAVVSDSGGSGSIYKYGNGTLLLSGSNTYSGLTSIQQGYVAITNNKSLGTGSATVNSGASLQISNGITVANAITFSGSGYGATNNGAIEVVNGTNTLTGNVSIDGLGVTQNARIQTDTGASLTLSGSIDTTANKGGLEIGGSGNTTIAGSISGNVTGLTKNGTGTLTMSGGDLMHNATIAVNAGTLSVQNNAALGSTSAANTITVANNATVAFDSTAHGNLAIPSTNNLTFAISGTGANGYGALQNTAGTNSVQATINVGGNSTISANSGTTLTLGGNITATTASTLTFGTNTGQNGSITVGALNSGGGGATLNVVKEGSVSGSNGILTITGGGSIGSLTLNHGGVTVQNNSTLTTTGLTANSGTTLLIAGGSTVDVKGSATFSSGTISSSSSGTLQVDGNNSLTFTGANITASNLTLVLNGGSVGTNSAPLTVYLGGSNVTVGTIKITGDTILDFGNSASTFLTSANLQISTGVKVTVKNWMSISGNATASTVWYVTNQTGGISNTNGTSSISLPPTQYGTGMLGDISFSNPTGSVGNTTTWVSGTSNGWFNDEIRPTPEPSTYGAILISGCLGLIGWIRFRRKTAAAKR